ncbi:MAG: M20/M25/M40 family metallo-hydrolase, partial [Candidatus Aminicenantaceae bacterium]
VNVCSSFLIKEFKKIGTKINHFPQDDIGDLYLIEYPPPTTKVYREKILLLTHLDTVWPVGKIEEMPFHISGNKVYGPGVLDMKSGLVMVIFSLLALKELKIEPRKKIDVFINSAEEVGSKSSYNLMKKILKKYSYVLCLEPALPGGNLKIQRKGRLVLRFTAHGKAAHGGTPQKGISAIEELILQLGLINKFKTKNITINIGLIGGGEKANIVPKDAFAILDIRFWKSSQKEKIIFFFKQLKPQLKGARIKFFEESFTPPMEKTRASLNLFSRIQKIAASLNMSLEGGKTGGGSDASIAASMGIPTVDGIGPDGEGIHAENEHLILSSLVGRTALLTEILRQL